MTKNECYTAFNIELDKIDSLQYPNFTDAEKAYFFDRAQEQKIKTIVTGNNSAGTSFEQNQKRMDDLRLLVVEATLPTVIDPGTLSEKPNCYIADLTDLTTDLYMYTVGEECTITYTDRISHASVNKIQPITECTANNYIMKVHDPLSPHLLHYNTAAPLRITKGDIVELISDGTYSVLNYVIRYIKQPTSFGTLLGTESPDFPTHVHSELVKLAVNIALESIESPRIQSYPIKVSEME
jgi:hypothetical protein